MSGRCGHRPLRVGADSISARGRLPPLPLCPKIKVQARVKNIIAFGPEMPGIDYRIHGADEFILVSGMEEAVLVYMEAIKNLLAI